MTGAEFKAWLDGYTEAGGSDAARIKAQADKIVSDPLLAWKAYPTTNPLPDMTPFAPYTTCGASSTTQ